MSKNILFLSTLILLFQAFAALALAGGEPEPFNLSQVADGIYLHSGVHVAFTDPQHDDIANIGFIVGNDCIAVIDTGGSVTIGQELLLSIREISNLPICYVINTHVHFDHILGNLAFKNEDAQFVGHIKLIDAIEQSRDFFLEQSKNDLGPAPNRNSIVGPNLGVDKTMELDLGNRLLRLTAYQTAHSNTDLTVLDLKTNTLWTGDLIFKERIPALSGKLKGWLAVLETLQNEAIDLAIPGHGTSSNNWPETFAAEQAYLKVLLNDIRQAISKGQFLEDAVNFVGKDEKQEWLLHEQHHARNVTKAFTELEWE
ncbi:MAG: quinoprotein relay system zinc metallohydrolase 2 [Nitrosomonadaceae bacterium]